MREFKFRAWDSVSKRMYPVDNASFTSGILSGVNLWHVDPYGNKRIKVMQYTGLKDRNGTEIYEGDICVSDKGFKTQVTWSEDVCDEYNCVGWSGVGSSYWHSAGLTVEVIGNIYENPDLLTEGK